MVYKWDCRSCSHAVWSDERARLDDEIRSHMFDHYAGRVSKSDFRYTWDCPFCGQSTTTHDRDGAVEGFEEHLADHVADRVERRSHVADEIDRCGNLLVEAPLESTSADYAREALYSIADVVVVVTSNPRARIELLGETLSEWPAHTAVLTTKRRPLDGTLDFDFSDVSIEIVEIDQRLGPNDLGETISRVIDRHDDPGRQLCLEFDIIYEIIRSFDLRTSYEFVSQISTRLREAGAVSQFYVDPQPQLESVLNVLDDEFDLKLAANERSLVSGG
jgi:hypothetical protein